MVRNVDHVTQTVSYGEILPGFPSILPESLEHVRAKDGISPMADFGVSIKEAQSRVRNCGASRSRHVARPDEISAVIAKKELTILVVRAGLAGLHIDFIVVVFSRVFHRGSELKRVISLNPTEAV